MFTGRIQMGILTKVPDNFLAINRISIGKMALEFSTISTLIQIYQLILGDQKF